MPQSRFRRDFGEPLAHFLSIEAAALGRSSRSSSAMSMQICKAHLDAELQDVITSQGNVVCSVSPATPRSRAILPAQPDCSFLEAWFALSSVPTHAIELFKVVEGNQT